MIDDVLAQPHQIADALWRTDAADVPSRALAGGLVVCGMGGSAIGGDLARAAIGDRATAPITTVRGYALEPWTAPDTLVLCASYSGNTEETLACFEAAGRLGAARVALTTGGELAARARAEGVPVIGVPAGMQPRAAVVYMTVAALECAAAAGAAPPLRAEAEAAAELLGGLAGEWSQDGEPAAIAERLEGRLPVVHGAQGSAAAARRWATQLNENSGVAAFAAELPEANHNQIEGWDWGARQAALAAVLLETPGRHPRVARRFELVAARLEQAGAPVVRVQARGQAGVPAVLSLVFLGDLVSVRLAERLGVEPGPVPALEAFKAELGKPQP